MIRKLRDYVYLPQSLLKANHYTHSKKYRIQTPDNRVLDLIAELADKLHACKCLPHKVRFFRSKDPTSDLDRYSDIMLTTGLAPNANSVSPDILRRFFFWGVPVVPIHDALCDFIDFELNQEFAFTCIHREVGLDDETWDEQADCPNGQDPKLCGQYYKDEDMLNILRRFYDTFPRVRVNEDKGDKELGRLPLFMYSFFMDHLLFEAFFGKEIFEQRFRFNNIANKMSAGVAADLLDARMSR